MTREFVGSLLACLLLCVVLTPPALAQDATQDVPFDTWHDWAIQTLVDEGIIIGFPDGTAKAEQPITRYEFAAAWVRLVEVLGMETSPLSLNDAVTDVPADHWARESVEKLAAIKLVPALPFSDVEPMHWAAFSVAALIGGADREGRRYLAFRGDEPVLRREYAEIVWRTWQAASRQEITPRVPREYGKDAAEFLVNEGVLVGYPDEKLYLNRPMQRFEFCLATVRLLEAFPVPAEE